MSRTFISQCAAVRTNGRSDRPRPRLGIAERFTFTGQVNNIADYLSGFDVFGYPLAPTHYGTCDQALAESMAAGVPPVVLSNGMERYMVEHGKTGLVAEDLHEYARAVEELCRNREMRLALSRNARQAARRRFSAEAMMKEWEDLFREVAMLPKKEKTWQGACAGRDVSPAGVFLESLGPYGSEFRSSLEAKTPADRMNADRRIGDLSAASCNWRSGTRGTVHHYHFFFPDDPYLGAWSELMKRKADGERGNARVLRADACDATMTGQRIENIKRSLKNNALIALTVEATSACNLKCVFCAMHSDSGRASKRHAKQKMRMDRGLFRDILCKLQGPEKLKALYLHGHGEPLLHPDIVAMVHEANAAGVAEQIVLITNGVFLNGDLFRRLVEAGATCVRVSLDAITPEKYRDIKGADVGSRVVGNIDECIELIRTARLPATLTIECMQPKTDGKVFVAETARILDYFGDKIEDLPSVAVRLREEFSWVDQIDRCTGAGRYRRKVPCEQPFYLLMVHADGDVSMCCGDVTKELVIGNMRAVSHITDILASRALNVRRAGLLNQDYSLIPGCEYCDAHTTVDFSLLSVRGSLLPLLPAAAG